MFVVGMGIGVRNDNRVGIKVGIDGAIGMAIISVSVSMSTAVSVSVPVWMSVSVWCQWWYWCSLLVRIGKKFRHGDRTLVSVSISVSVSMLVSISILILISASPASGARTPPPPPRPSLGGAGGSLGVFRFQYALCTPLTPRRQDGCDPNRLAP